MTELNEFQNDCMKLPHDVVVQKYLIDGSAFFFDHIICILDEEFLFKKDLADSLNLHIRDIVIVGSAKLGFSIKPEQGAGSESLYRYKQFDEDSKIDVTKKKSDIDVAIISNELFDSQLLKLYKYTDAYRNRYKVRNFCKYSNYLLKGWIRPDMMPDGYTISDEIARVMKKFSTKYNRKISFGIYKSWHYFEQYHVYNIKTIRTNLQMYKQHRR